MCERYPEPLPDYRSYFHTFLKSVSAASSVSVSPGYVSSSLALYVSVSLEVDGLILRSDRFLTYSLELVLLVLDWTG
jgi:hypothetical protein